MSELPIYNCHVHTFTVRHAPRYLPAIYVPRYLRWLVVVFSGLARRPGAMRWLLALIKFVPWLRRAAGHSRPPTS
jgi:hypothetical protein